MVTSILRTTVILKEAELLPLAPTAAAKEAFFDKLFGLSDTKFNPSQQ